MGLVPDLEADIVPGISAAGLSIGSNFFELCGMLGCREINVVDRRSLWQGVGEPSTEKFLGLEINQLSNWSLTLYLCAQPDKPSYFISSLRYIDGSVTFESVNGTEIHRILIEKNYRGKYFGVGVGDPVTSLRNLSMPFEFDPYDEEFYLLSGGEYLLGISFASFSKCDLNDDPDQTIDYISVHDWDMFQFKVGLT